MNGATPVKGVVPNNLSNINSAKEINFKNFGINPQRNANRSEYYIDEFLQAAYNDGSLERILNETCPEACLRARVLDILNPANENIATFCDDNDGGTAQWHKESGRIIINTSEKTSYYGFKRLPWGQCSAVEKLKILVHEAMHGAQVSDFDTQKEELLCETTAIKTAVAFAKTKGLLLDAKYPGTDVTFAEIAAMQEPEMKKFLGENFIERGYSNRIKDETGAVTLCGANNTGIDIPAGAKIRIGEHEYEIGKTFIEGIGALSGTICNFFVIRDDRLANLGVVTFDELKFQEQDVHNPQFGRFVKPNENDYQEAVIIIEGQEHKMKVFDFRPEIY